MTKRALTIKVRVHPDKTHVFATTSKKDIPGGYKKLRAMGCVAFREHEQYSAEDERPWYYVAGYWPAECQCKGNRILLRDFQTCSICKLPVKP